MTAFTRRQFLAGLAATASLPLLSRPASAAEDSYDVIVVGAGISGLRAASWLNKQGYDVLVLESRNRLGGRVWTDSTLGFPVDLGASWIHEAKGNPITALCQQANITTVVDPDHWQLRTPDGKVLPEESDDRLDALQDELLQGASLDSKRSQGALVRAALKAHPLNSTEQLMLREVYHGCATEYGALPDDVSEAELLDSGYDGPDRLFPGGYAQVARVLAEGLLVKLSEAVTGVEWGSFGVRVSTSKSGYQARAAIITLPLGVLQKGSVAFSPALPDAQKGALGGLRMGLLNKIVLTFAKPFWPSSYQHFANLSPDIGVLGEILNLQAVFGHSGLLLFLAGKPAREREGWTVARQQAEAEAMLGRLFPGSSPKAQRCLISRWAADPHAHGSYSYLPPGVSPETRSRLAQPQPPLFFAGEATHVTMSATVHGAYLSGTRAAKEVDEWWP